jgi:hypothetical protein
LKSKVPEVATPQEVSIGILVPLFVYPTALGIEVSADLKILQIRVLTPD